MLLKSRSIWLKSAFIRDLGRVELWRRKENGMGFLATILRPVYFFVSRLEFYFYERQTSLAISSKCGDFSHRPNLLNERNLPFWNAQSTALKTEMVPISLASAKQNPPINFFLLFLASGWSYVAIKWQFAKGNTFYISSVAAAGSASDTSPRHFEVKNTQVDCCWPGCWL